MGLTAGQAALLKRMREDNRQAGFPFAPEGRWAETVKKFDAYFAKEGIGDVELQRYNAHFSCYPDKRHPVWVEYACALLYHHVRDGGGAEALRRVDASGGHMCSSLDGPVSWDFLISLDTLVTLDGLAGFGMFDDPVTVVDLGAGWGRIGYVLCRANPQARYVACDLPEPLLVSSTYLPRLLDRCHPYGVLPGGPGAYFLGAQGLGELPDGSVDAAINVASFQEMTEGQVRAYCGIIERKARYFYTQQSYPVSPYPERWEELRSRVAVWSPKYYEKVFRL